MSDCIWFLGNLPFYLPLASASLVLTGDADLINPIDTATAGIWLNQVPDLSRLSGLTHAMQTTSFASLNCRSLGFTLASSIFVSYSLPPFATSRSSLPLYLTALPYTCPITWEFVDAPPTTMTPSSFSWHICTMSVFTGLNA
ncbi:hypothetical protein B0H13DRAFT_919688 [Mycena leptocephala]|nr:hypothetical protein B0H13DRAFT_919688 [Mycena leptocephala]